MKRIVSLALASLFVLQSAAFAAPRAFQDPDAPPMTNADVVRMVKAKITPDVIVAKFKSSRCHFDTQASILAELRQTGVPDSVLMAMVKAPYGEPNKAPAWKGRVPPAGEPEEKEPATTRSVDYGTGPNNKDWAKMGDEKKPEPAPVRTGPTRGELALESTPTGVKADEGAAPKPTVADTYIRRNATVYIDDMGGFEHYLASALRKKTVPLIVVLDPMQADYIIFGVSQSKRAGWAKMFFMGDARSGEMASITMVDRRTKVVVFADASHRYSAFRGQRSTAEKLAKYLDRKISKDQKKL